MTRPTSDTTRGKTSLIPRLDTRLLAYSAAATAAGVGLLAISQSAEAKIVYTAANVTIPVNGGLIQFDLNNDGVPDFGFYNGQFSGGVRHPLGAFNAYLTAFPAKASNEVWTVTSSKGSKCAGALPAGVAVGPKGPFQPNSAPMWWVAGDYTSPGSVHCPWQNKHHGAFLGLKFVVNGQTHFGWAHVTIGSSTVLNGYAYETVPNQPIHTGQTSGPVSDTQANLTPLPIPQPATLGLLAQGSRGMSIWRRPEELAS